MPRTFATSRGGSGGSAYDLLSTLTAAEISVTGAVTATISRMHVCSGTSANYSVTLPAASGNTGKFIGFRMAGIAALSKLVTLDGNSSETINGALTRIMWANESAILLCDGSNWFKVAGESIAMAALMHLSANQSINTATLTKITVDTIDINNTGAMANTGSNQIDILRPGLYAVNGLARYKNLVSNTDVIFSIPRKNTTDLSQSVMGAFGAWHVGLLAGQLTECAAGDNIDIATYQATIAAQNVIGASAIADACYLNVLESPQW